MSTTPIPGDLESREVFTARFVGHPSLANHTPARRHGMADAAWEAARLRSRVSVKNAHGEFLCFD